MGIITDNKTDNVFITHGFTKSGNVNESGLGWACTYLHDNGEVLTVDILLYKDEVFFFNASNDKEKTWNDHIEIDRNIVENDIEVLNYIDWYLESKHNIKGGEKIVCK